MLKTNMINFLKSFRNVNNLNAKQALNISNDNKFFLNFSGLNNINKFAFAEKSTMDLIKILRAETSNKNYS